MHSVAVKASVILPPYPYTDTHTYIYTDTHTYTHTHTHTHTSLKYASNLAIPISFHYCTFVDSLVYKKCERFKTK